ncbi:MAG TPA: SDR family oxidoreductase [Candidatus Binatia bacterium]|jgi:3-oxoacyl-[acyl-carrier protein] reductase|nr:SDR family oxidoreductase [Candidatus Binatia bacterium]
MFEQKVALITGGARGIARAVTLDLAARGWSVAICYRTSAKEASDVIVAVKQAGAKGLAFQSDVSDAGAATELVRRVYEEWGRIDALINGAGPYHRVSLLEETIEGWHSMFDNNLHPVFYLTRAVIPIMKNNKWGRIVSFSMANAEQLIAQPQLTSHYISKVGLLALSRSFARLIARDGITMNCVSPGFIDSGSAPEGELERMVKSIPAGYVGTVDDVVAAVRFLVSDEARYVNGANIQLSGAWGV